MAAKKARKADRVSGDLLKNIVSGQIATGAILPKESELADHYAVTKGVVREAIKLLEVHKLVRPIRRRGTEVLDPYASPSPDVIHAMLHPGPDALDLEVLDELLEVRAVLDIQMTTLAAERHRAEDIPILEAALEDIRAAGDPAASAAAHRALALGFARATHNRIFTMLVHWDLQIRGDIDAAILTIREPTPALLQGIAFLIDLVRRREVEAVRDLMTAYHRWARPAILQAARERLQENPEDER